MTEHPTARNRSFDRIATDIASVARTWSEESRLVRDEAMGAELLLAREVVEQFGILFESVDRLNDLFVRQVGHLFRDYAETLQRAATEPGLHNCRDVALTHLQRRIEHIAEGSDEFSTLLQSEARKLGDIAFGLWRPFASMIDRDWQQRQSPSASS